MMYTECDQNDHWGLCKIGQKVSKLSSPHLAHHPLPGIEYILTGALGSIFLNYGPWYGVELIIICDAIGLWAGQTETTLEISF